MRADSDLWYSISPERQETQMQLDIQKTTGAISDIAHAVASAIVPESSLEQQDNAVAECWDTLLQEAQSLVLSQPDAETVNHFIFRQSKLVDTYITNSEQRDNLLATLETLRQPGPDIEPALFYAWSHLWDYTLYSLSRTQHANPLTIAVDLDGCLYDFNNTMREWLVARGWDRDQLIEPTQYYTQRAWGIADQVFQQEMIHALKEGIMFREGLAFPEALRSIRRLGEAGHRLVGNSARNFHGHSDHSRAATLLWLRENGVHLDGLHLADPVDPKDKLSQPFDLLIDDHPGNVEAALASGRNAVLLNRPWNLTYTHLPRATYPEIARDPHRFIQ